LYQGVITPIFGSYNFVSLNSRLESNKEKESDLSLAHSALGADALLGGLLAVPDLGLRVYGLWFMVCGLWFMVYSLWFMVYGLWFMAYGLWFMVQGLYMSSRLTVARSR